MYEPLTALELEQKASKLLDVLVQRSFHRQDNIKYLASVLLDYYNRGYDASIVIMGDIKS